MHKTCIHSLSIKCHFFCQQPKSNLKLPIVEVSFPVLIYLLPSLYLSLPRICTLHMLATLWFLDVFIDIIIVVIELPK